MCREPFRSKTRAYNSSWHLLHPASDFSTSIDDLRTFCSFAFFITKARNRENTKKRQEIEKCLLSWFRTFDLS